MTKLLLIASLWLVLLQTVVAAPPEKEEDYDNDYAQLGEACTLYWHGQGQYYKPANGNSKAAKLATCRSDLQTKTVDGAEYSYTLACQGAVNDSGADVTGVMEVEGKCQDRGCGGLDDTNEITTATAPAEENEATERVTICHRTCSATNPWVRITIDNDAWQKGDEFCGEANGHQPDSGVDDGVGNKGHKVSDCNVDDTTPWGSNTGDYQIKWHGTRESIAYKIASNSMEAPFTDMTEKEYWGYWERACPYVRMAKENGKRCCGLEKSDGTIDYSDCCGLAAEKHFTGAPSIVPTDTPTRGPTSSPSKSPVAEPESGTTAPTGFCPEITNRDEDKFEATLYITINGPTNPTGDHTHDTLSEFLSEAVIGLTNQDLETAIMNAYNTLGGDGVCELYTRRISSVSIDTASVVPAMNKDHSLVGRRYAATVNGFCVTDGCKTEPLLPQAVCDTTVESYCPDCVDLAKSLPGYIVTIAGKNILALVNEELAINGTQAEIIRLQGTISGETECSTGYKYILSSGDVKCIG